LRLRALKRIAETLERDGAKRRTIDGSNHRGIAAARQNFTQTRLQRAELTKLRMRIADHVRSTRAGGNSYNLRVVACNDDDQTREWLESEDGHGEKRGAGRRD
jgi:hypothetical protein